MNRCVHEVAFGLAEEDNRMLARVCALSGQSRAAIGREALRIWMMWYLLRRQEMEGAIARLEVQAAVAGSVDNQEIIAG